ncbi:MAG: adenylosuccinate synthetase [Flavitalea sp.]
MESFKGWNKDITAMKSPSELPTEMTEYVAFINKYLGVNINYISNGPGRDQLVKIG